MPEPCRLHKIAALWVSERFGKRQQRFTLRWWEFSVGQTVDLKLLHSIDGITKQLTPGLFSGHGSQRHRQPLNKRLMKVCQGCIEFWGGHQTSLDLVTLIVHGGIALTAVRGRVVWPGALRPTTSLPIAAAEHRRCVVTFGKGLKEPHRPGLLESFQMPNHHSEFGRAGRAAVGTRRSCHKACRQTGCHNHTGCQPLPVIHRWG